MIAIVAGFIKNIEFNCSYNLTGGINTNTYVKTTVTLLMSMAKVIMKKGRT